MLHHLISITSLLLLLVSGALALYDKNGSVVIVNEKNWLDEVLTTEQVVVVEFFAPWCGHCKKLTPEYVKAAESLKGLVKFAAVDCDDQSNSNVCTVYEIKGFPTIKLFPSKMTEDRKKPGNYYKKAKDYNGPRTAKAIADFALPEIPSYVQPISNENPTTKTLTIEEFLEKNDTLSKAILFTNKDQTTYLYKALSVDFHDRLLLGEVRKREKIINKKYGVKEYPKLIVISRETDEIVEYKEPEFQESITEHENNLSILKKVKESTHKKHEDDKLRFSFMWFNAFNMEAKNLIKDFKLSDVFPNLMVLNPNRKLYRPYLGPFDQERIEKFLDDVTKGRGTSYEFNFEVTMDEKDMQKKDEKKGQTDKSEVEKRENLDDEKCGIEGVCTEESKSKEDGGKTKSQERDEL
ncbi:6968_t:CDS:2 [Acaulospora morrowiae]|uniref:protein disulfide-isomerase n=1 Tax=Acaulospora morrowiae TaxID=94023 RepID=A0A9N9CGN6_9GLOM|nr:6968_t:CDS:2 [Acaulospora morrowiae]